MTTVRSSPEHVLACLTELRALVGPPSRDPEQAEATILALGKRITAYPPEVVTRACERAADEHDRFPRWAALKRLLDAELAEHERRQRERALPPPSEAQRALEQAMSYLPQWAIRSLDYATDENGGTPWKTVCDRQRILAAVAEVWRRVAPPMPDARAAAAFGDRLARALAAAIAAGDPMLLLGEELLPAWPQVRDGWWSHAGLRRVVEQLERAEIAEPWRTYALDQLRAHLEAGRMPADIADRAIALVHGRRVEIAA